MQNPFVALRSLYVFFGVFFFFLLSFLRGFCLSVNQDASNLIPLTDGQPNRSSGEGLIYFTSGKKLCSSGHDFKLVPDSFFFCFFLKRK